MSLSVRSAPELCHPSSLDERPGATFFLGFVTKTKKELFDPFRSSNSGRRRNRSESPLCPHYSRSSPITERRLQTWIS